MANNVVFVVSSVIHCSTSALSYTYVRSAFTSEERAQQTLQTIESIRAKVPAARVVLIEMGLDHAPDEIQKLADRYLYVGNRRIVREAADGPHKGYGEAVGLVLANRHIQALEPDYCFKMSGRYYLNNQFGLSNWNRDCFTARIGPGWLTTTLYGFPYKQYEVWRRTLKEAIPFLRQGEAIENTMWRLLPNICPIGVLGVSGAIAPWGQEVSL